MGFLAISTLFPLMLSCSSTSPPAEREGTGGTGGGGVGGGGGGGGGADSCCLFVELVESLFDEISSFFIFPMM